MAMKEASQPEKVPKQSGVIPLVCCLGFFLSSKSGCSGTLFPSGCLFLPWSSSLGYDRAALCPAMPQEEPGSSSLLWVIFTFFLLSYI